MCDATWCEHWCVHVWFLLNACADLIMGFIAAIKFSARLKVTGSMLLLESNTKYFSFSFFPLSLSTMRWRNKINKLDLFTPLSSVSMRRQMCVCVIMWYFFINPIENSAILIKWTLSIYNCLYNVSTSKFVGIFQNCRITTAISCNESENSEDEKSLNWEIPYASIATRWARQ